MTPPLKTKRDRLTPYGFACGYVESREFDGGLYSIRLWREHGCYHVRMHHKHNGRVFWDSYRTLTDARKRYEQALSYPRLIKSSRSA
jgi:hypothetical protein